MGTKLTTADAKQSMTDHAAIKGTEIYEKHGPQIGWRQLQQILEDRACCRYPCEIVFDAAPLEPGEFAYPAPKGEWPEDGFTLHVHPHFLGHVDRVAYLVLYQLVAMNYGEFASPADAEVFASSALGLPREEYYQALCGMADEIGGGPENDCGESGCSCH